MKRKISLVEFLVFIAIFLIILIVAIITVLNVVEKANKDLVSTYADNYVDAIERQMIINYLNEDIKDDIKPSIYEIKDLDKKFVTVKGDKPISGWVVVTKNGVDSYSFVINNYVVSYNGEIEIIEKGNKAIKKGK